VAATIPGVTTVLHLDEVELKTVRQRAAAVLNDGGLVVVPTDTVYGVLANPFHPEGAQRLFAARQASRSIPLPVVIHNPRQLPALAKEVPEVAERLMASYWPGPLTLLLQVGETMAWDLGDDVRAVAFRMPAEPVILQILASTGPLACTSASTAGGPVPTTLEQARAALGDAVALYVDGGTRDGKTSTVVDVSRGGAEVRRVGAVSADDVFGVVSGSVGLGRRPGDEPVEAAPPAEAMPADGAPPAEAMPAEQAAAEPSDEDDG
jgi:L-threonylcarbamoyladenylate synthase